MLCEKCSPVFLSVKNNRASRALNYIRFSQTLQYAMTVHAIKLPMTSPQIETSLTLLKDTCTRTSQIIEQFQDTLSQDQNGTVVTSMNGILQPMLPGLENLAKSTKVMKDTLANRWLIANQPRSHA